MSLDIKPIVNECVKLREGGAEFFDLLDDSLANYAVCRAVYSMVSDPHRYTFICSGSFGKLFVMWMRMQNQERAGHILFPGGLRTGIVKAPIDYDIPSAWENRACYVDDSYYSGTTRLTCLHLLFNVEKTCQTFVAYDGSPAPRPDWLHSLYRWHPEEGK